MQTEFAPPMDREAALERLGGDAELLDELLPLMLEQSLELIGTMRHALADGDAKSLVVAAHTIRGSAANLEAADLAAAAERVERLARGDDLAEGATACAAVESELQRLALYVGKA